MDEGAGVGEVAVAQLAPTPWFIDGVQTLRRISREELRIARRRSQTHVVFGPSGHGSDREVAMRYLVGLAWALGLVVAPILGCSGAGESDGSGAYAWCEVDPPVFGRDFWAASFPEAETGTIVGGIYRTTDGGGTWTSQESPLGDDAGYSDVSFTDLDHGTIVWAGGVILRTTDGGASWVTQNSGTGESLAGVSFSDTENGMVVGSAGTILRTTDGGATWISQESGTDALLNGVWMNDASTATAVGLFGTILRTTNGGASWTPQDSGTESNLRAVSFATVNAGVAVGWDGTMLRTTDGGTTWEAVDGFGTIPLNDVWFADANVGTVVGASGLILRTTDAGATWHPEETDAAVWHWDTLDDDPARIGKTFNGVSMADANNGFAVGAFQSVARRTRVSDDSGVCDPLCEKTFECYPESAAGCEIDCLCNLRYHGWISPECEAAVVASSVCFSALTCEQIDAYFDDPYNHPCTAAEARIDLACDPEAPSREPSP